MKLQHSLGSPLGGSGFSFPLFYPTGGLVWRRDFRRRMVHSTASVAATDSGTVQANRIAISDTFGVGRDCRIWLTGQPGIETQIVNIGNWPSHALAYQNRCNSHANQQRRQ